ncbi:MAG: polyphosphate kinase 2 [Burkholderiales bacterium]|nr:polyphosphate kinase 2 [Burkholderiales bacterium]
MSMKKNKYESLLEPLQQELSNVARWLQHTGKRLVIVFEGRDAAGKGGSIHAIAQRLNPRQVRVAALAKPTERERTQWYFQRYAGQLPAAGECVMFDRSWYNRAGVERVMGYCTPAEYALFLQQVPLFERMLVEDGILLFKYWLAVDQEEQEARFAERAQDPLKRWKLSPIDLEARRLYAEYGRARDAMLRASHTRHAPWHIVDFNDQRRGRLNLIRHLLEHVPDVALAAETLKLPPLGHAPLAERYTTKIKPIRSYY